VLDGTHLTGMRTGAAGALAAKMLSRKNAKTAGFVGCGEQARMQLTCLKEVRNIASVKVWQRSARSRSAARFCEWARDSCGVEASISSSIDEVTTGTDIVITTTPSEKPLVGEVSPGTHINAFGADAPGKQEIDGRILKQAKVVIDDWTQASHSGEINVPLARRQIFKKDIHGELGEITAGRKAGREREEEITLFDSTGLAVQDICCAAAVYERIAAGEGAMEIRLF
jgi:alanine dehydrogenase